MSRSAGDGPLELQVDHVSIAVPDIAVALPFFRRHFPLAMGSEKRPGHTGDFNWCDFYLGNFKLELIESTHAGSFVDRFLAKRGPGLHHWSLEVVQLRPLIQRMEAEGLRIVDKYETARGDFSAFISPRSARGVLVQFWQVSQLSPPRPRHTVPFVLSSGSTVHMSVDHLSLAVRDIEATLAFFRRYFPFHLRRPPHPGWEGTFLVSSFSVNGYKVELIQNIPGKPGFVERFIERRGEGMHHISIDIDSLDPYVAHLEAAGVRVVDKRELRDGHKTAFISPRSAYGVLIQLWQAPEPRAPDHGR